MSVKESTRSVILRTNKLCFNINKKVEELDSKICELHKILLLINEKVDKL